jgi:hypothetical protein
MLPVYQSYKKKKDKKGNPFTFCESVPKKEIPECQNNLPALGAGKVRAGINTDLFVLNFRRVTRWFHWIFLQTNM